MQLDRAKPVRIYNVNGHEYLSYIFGSEYPDGGRQSGQGRRGRGQDEAGDWVQALQVTPNS